MALLNPNDADDSDSSDSTWSPVRVPRRSATVSPSTRRSFRHGSTRRKSDVNLHFTDIQRDREQQRERRRSMVRASRERSESRRKGLRKTNSEPSVDSPTIDVRTLQQLLLSLPKFTNYEANRLNDSDFGGEDVMSTEIEELKDAAKSIQSLQRVLAQPSQHSSDLGVYSEADEGSLTTENGETRVSGISTRLGHPRGVMQFLPSVRCYEAVASVRTRRRGVVDPMFAPAPQLKAERPSEALVGVSRFSKLLNSFQSRPTSPEQHPSITWSPFMCSSNGGDDEGRMEDSLHEADILLWKKRSRASLRRHNSVRNMAVRELFDTEKSFIEGLEYLVTKYMRPLRQPLECTLIEAPLVDKIFHRIPEILAHHQVLLAALSAKLENWHKDSVIGDVLLAHFSKQSMVETYISFVDNFKFAKEAICQARQKQAFEKYYNRCCRDHHNKLDLDSLLISPIQRVPRYELIVNQMLKHTPVEHEDRDRLLRAQRHIHLLATAINQHKEGNEQMEQRLREIEAIVDGLDDLVSTNRTLLRYDIVNLSGKQRCFFMLSDQLLLTSVKKKAKMSVGKLSSQSMDFLENNRFKLLIKISLEDVRISKGEKEPTSCKKLSAIWKLRKKTTAYSKRCCNSRICSDAIKK
ncbi:unnamed protein product [Caenorhabditis auriculariae]|uniref:DH domain-containing protein n=1 Tax=Caenorhabditis auriculariae TaxID=2777116 RepID=A0A8S1GYQ4_9PELO|nr:unnamed protein product [Caenorhabditis auriculariae]